MSKEKFLRTMVCWSQAQTSLVRKWESTGFSPGQTTCLLLHPQGNSPKLQAQTRGQREDQVPSISNSCYGRASVGSLASWSMGEMMPKQDKTPMVEAPSVTMTHVGKTGKCIKYDRPQSG